MTVKTPYGNITAPKRVINLLALYSSIASSRLYESDMDGIAEKAKEISDILNSELKKWVRGVEDGKN